jgi:hypothetical protein
MSLPKHPDPDVRLVVVYRTRNLALSAVAKSILDAAPVEYMVRGDSQYQYSGMSEFDNRPDLGMEFLVREADAEWVRELLTDLTPASETSKDSE